MPQGRPSRHVFHAVTPTMSDKIIVLLRLRCNHRMKTILVSMLHEHGHLNPSFKVSRTLKVRGYDVEYLNTLDFEEYIGSQGFGFVPFLPELYQKGWIAERDKLGGLDVRRMITRQFNAVSERLLDPAGLSKTIKRIAPDLMIIDINHTLIAYVAWRLGIPTLAMNVTLPQTKDAGVPPLRTGARYYPGLKGRIHAEIEWGKFLVGRKLLALGADLVGLCPPYELARRAARRFGYPPARLDSKTVYMPRLVGTPELVLCPEGFDFPRPYQPDRHFVESVDLDRVEGEFPWGRIDASKLLVFVSMGSQRYQLRNVRRFLKIATKALASRPEWQAIVALGRHLAPDEVRDCPPNVVAVKSVPQLAVLKRARLMVTHGGLGSVKECIVHGVPMIVFPLAVDQHDNAVRVEHHGLGLRGNIRDVSPARLLMLIDALLRNPDHRPRLAAMRARFEVIERGTRGADLAEEAIAQSR